MPLPATPTREFVTGLPKSELHIHLEGTLEPALKLELAERNGIDIGQRTVEEVEATYQFDSLTSFLAVYYPAMDVLRTQRDFYDLARAYLERAGADGVRHVEMFFDPQAHTSRGVPFEDVVAGYHAGCRRGRGRRHRRRPDHVLPARPQRRERRRDAGSVAAVPRLDRRRRPRLRRAGQPAGEVRRRVRPGPPARLPADDALRHRPGRQHRQHPHRAARTSAPTASTTARTSSRTPPSSTSCGPRGIGLTCCPISNRFVTGDMKAAEIAELLRSGVLVTVNSDDPAYFGGYIVDNYLALAERPG